MFSNLSLRRPKISLDIDYSIITFCGCGKMVFTDTSLISQHSEQGVRNNPVSRSKETISLRKILLKVMGIS